MQRMAHSFAENRTAGVMHLRNPDGSVVKAGRVVGSVVFTKELQAALGCDIGYEPWLVSVAVDDPRVAKAVKAGQLRSFSIGGRGLRIPFDVED
jgi:hypothetical protein